MATAPDHPETLPLIFRPEETSRQTGLSDRHLRLLESQNRFPKRFRLNPPNGQAVGHSAKAVMKWVEERIRATEAVD